MWEIIQISVAFVDCVLVGMTGRLRVDTDLSREVRTHLTHIAGFFLSPIKLVVNAGKHRVAVKERYIRLRQHQSNKGQKSRREPTGTTIVTDWRVGAVSQVSEKIAA